jgi:hypothetical protein
MLSITDLLGKIVEPTKFSDNEMEWLVNSGMRMRVIDVRYEEDSVYMLTVDLSEFVDYNKMYMHYNFYDENGKPCLNVYESGMIGPDNLDTLYIEDTTFHAMLNIIESS